MRAGRWVVERRVGDAAALHALGPPVPWRPLVRICEPVAPALVLGSSQPEPAAPPGLAVVRRRSGGGAVWLEPGGGLWVDVCVPAGDPRWCDDVARSFHWLGAVWVGALGRLGVEADWHDGAFVAGPLGRVACFAALGPGEVTVAGRKVVGMSQRRSAAGALVQCLALARWDPAALGRALGVDLSGVAAAGLDVPPSRLARAFLAEIARW